MFRCYKMESIGRRLRVICGPCSATMLDSHTTRKRRSEPINGYFWRSRDPGSIGILLPPPMPRSRERLELSTLLPRSPKGGNDRLSMY